MVSCTPDGSSRAQIRPIQRVADGATIDVLDASTLFIPENQFDSLTTVYGGATVVGDKLLEVPAEGWQSGVLAVSPDIASDDTFVAVQ